MKTKRLLRALSLAVVVAVGSIAGAASAQTNIEKLKQFKVSGTDLNIPPVPQTGKNADAINENLKRIKLPPGFRIELFAIVPDARHMAIAPSTNMLFVGTRKTTVWAVTDRNSDGVADEVKPFAPSLKEAWEMPRPRILGTGRTTFNDPRRLFCSAPQQKRAVSCALQLM